MGIKNENLIKIFEYALHQENTGMSFFQISLERLSIGAAITAFKKLIEEEKKHVVFIRNILNDLQEGGEGPPSGRLHSMPHLRAGVRGYEAPGPVGSGLPPFGGGGGPGSRHGLRRG